MYLFVTKAIVSSLISSINKKILLKKYRSHNELIYGIKKCFSQLLFYVYFSLQIKQKLLENSYSSSGSVDLPSFIGSTFGSVF